MYNNNTKSRLIARGSTRSSHDQDILHALCRIVLQPGIRLILCSRPRMAASSELSIRQQWQRRRRPRRRRRLLLSTYYYQPNQAEGLKKARERERADKEKFLSTFETISLSLSLSLPSIETFLSVQQHVLCSNNSCHKKKKNNIVMTGTTQQMTRKFLDVYCTSIRP